MVMDLQDVGTSLEDGIKKSTIRLFGTSEAPLLANDTQAEVNDSEDESEDESTAEQDDSEDDEEDQTSDGDEEFSDIDVEDGRVEAANTGRTVLRRPPRSTQNLTKEKRGKEEADYASSDSELGELDEEDMYNAHYEDEGGDDIPTDDDFDQDRDEKGGDDGPQWKSNLTEKALLDYRTRTNRRKDWMKLIYRTNLTPEQILASEQPELKGAEKNDDDDDFFKIKRQADADLEAIVLDQTKEAVDEKLLLQWQEEEMLDSIRHLFITGSADNADNADNDDDAEAMDEGGDGDFVDLEKEATAEKTKKSKPSTAEELALKKEVLKKKFDEQYDGESDDNEEGGSGKNGEKPDFYTQKKTEMAQQLALNRTELEGLDPEARALVEGYRAGAYIRLELRNVPHELITHFDPSFPLIAGGLLPAEEHMGILQARIKRHRWFIRTLKTNDPLIISLGWRRFQTIPLYALDDHSIRMRLLKYTPEHMHCYASFYGPTAVPGTGFCAFNQISMSTPHFRISASGAILDIDRAAKIVKKLKLTGVPFKIFKNTAFIKDMFGSALEVAKFEGARIRTVSGIRGQIKRALPKPEGSFRASFEDKILMSGRL